MSKRNFKDETIGEQNRCPQIFLACKLFQIENNQGLKGSGRNFDLANCLKNLGRGPFIGIELTPENMG